MAERGYNRFLEMGPTDEAVIALQTLRTMTGNKRAVPLVMEQKLAQMPSGEARDAIAIAVIRDNIDIRNKKTNMRAPILQP